MFKRARDFIKTALAEDIGHGDITSELIVGSQSATAHIIAKEDFVLSGMPFIREVFDILDSRIVVEVFAGEGETVRKGCIISGISGDARALLAGERTALNILQRLSGISTLTAAYVDRVKDYPVKIVDTRKTGPGMRVMEKYAVTAGGGSNHRFGLFDGILIKDNHISIAGGIAAAISKAKLAHHLLKIEIEIRDVDQLRQAVDAGADVIMLDNMTVEDMKKAVTVARSLNSRILLEASGNINLDNVRETAASGVDLISVGAITHSARAVDISMKMKMAH
jgi:nicotinate-nucleotide pyrophosphorylase (carboxylating)